MLFLVIDASGLSQLLQDDASLTLFAPTNGAFEKLGQDKLAHLLQGGACLKSRSNSQYVINKTKTLSPVQDILHGIRIFVVST